MPEMTPAYEIVALLVARGLTNQEISDATGYNPNYIWRIKNETEGFESLVNDFKNEIQMRIIEDTVDIMTMFNREVPAMADNLKSLALDAKKEGVRLRATMDWLDRAPDAPKRIQRSENLNENVIMIGIQQVKNMKAAFADLGATELIELVEGEGFTSLDTPAAEGEEIVPREIDA